MVVEGQAQASMSRKTATVDFLDSEEQEHAQTLQLISAIEKQNCRIVELASKAAKMDNAIKLDPKYLSKRINPDGQQNDGDENMIMTDAMERGDFYWVTFSKSINQEMIH